MHALFLLFAARFCCAAISRFTFFWQSRTDRARWGMRVVLCLLRWMLNCVKVHNYLLSTCATTIDSAKAKSISTKREKIKQQQRKMLKQKSITSRLDCHRSSKPIKLNVCRRLRLVQLSSSASPSSMLLLISFSIDCANIWHFSTFPSLYVRLVCVRVSSQSSSSCYVTLIATCYDSCQLINENVDVFTFAKLNYNRKSQEKKSTLRNVSARLSKKTAQKMKKMKSRAQPISDINYNFLFRQRINDSRALFISLFSSSSLPSSTSLADNIANH